MSTEHLSVMGLDFPRERSKPKRIGWRSGLGTTPWPEQARDQPAYLRRVPPFPTSARAGVALVPTTESRQRTGASPATSPAASSTPCLAARKGVIPPALLDGRRRSIQVAALSLRSGERAARQLSGDPSPLKGKPSSRQRAATSSVRQCGGGRPLLSPLGRPPLPSCVIWPPDTLPNILGCCQFPAPSEVLRTVENDSQRRSKRR